MVVKRHLDEYGPDLDLEAALAQVEAGLAAAQRLAARGVESQVDGPPSGYQDLGVPEAAVRAFVETAHDLMGDGTTLTPEAARRGAMLAVAAEAWEQELGPLLSSSQLMGLVGIKSRQSVSDRLERRRLIGLRDRSGRLQFPLFQVATGAVDDVLVQAFWIVAAEADDWTAASWCTSPDPALGGATPASFRADGGDGERLLTVARQDAARLGL